MKISEFIKSNIKKLQKTNISNSSKEIHYILQEQLNFSLEEIIFNKDYIIDDNQITKLNKIINQRVNGKPISKIFKKSYFRDIELFVNKHTFSPRIDSEVLIDVLVKENINFKNIIELGTGTGALSISLLKYFKGTNALVTDISKEAIYIAKKNAIINNTFNRMQFVCCNWLDCFDNLNFDILISNPPYVRTSDILNLDVEVKKYDPLTALDGGADGLVAYEEILNSIKQIGKKDFWLLFEIGYDQAETVTKMMTDSGIKNIRLFKDYNNLPRCVLGKLEMS